MNSMTTARWLNKEEYPFKSHFYKTAAGNMHYLDEGTGSLIVFVHGNPSWSFEFRRLLPFQMQVILWQNKNPMNLLQK